MKSVNPLLALAWLAVLLASLPKIVLQEAFRIPLSADLQAGMTLTLALLCLALTFVWRAVRPLRLFLGLMAVLTLTEWLVYARLGRLPVYAVWLEHSSFSVSLLAQQSLRLMVTLVIIGIMFLVKRRASAFFLAKGELSAPVEPVRWLGADPGERWNRFGRNFTFYISLGTLVFLVLAGRPALETVVQAMVLLPAVLLAAALNAFNEEMTYKASFLSVLEEPAGKQQALWLMAAFFGLGHYYGVPYGVVGVLMAGFLGWLLGKSMLETRGLFWAWFIHFWQDVLIFSFMAMGSIRSGGS